jgi:hypothetical protein
MASIEIYIGELIEHASERVALARTVDFLTAQGISAVIIANVNLKTRQIDLIVAFDQGVLLVEAKAFASMVRGGENGLWELRLASGRWKQIPNAYQQTIYEKLALRDAMGEFVGGDVPYADAALVFTPAIPAGSSIPPSDFKVAIIGIDDLPTLIQSVKRQGWTLDQWRAFAVHHRLVPVPSVEAALSEALLDAGLLLKAYGEAFTGTYGAPASELVSVSCQCEGQLLSSETVIERSLSASNVILIGPSGCGKTLISYKLAVAALARGCVPMVLPAKDFEGNLRNVANREATLLGAHSAQAILSAARRLDRQLLLVVDGYNECTPAERQRLTRSIAAAVRRYNAHVVLSSQSAIERDDLLPARVYAVQQPDKKAKLTIAEQAGGVRGDVLEPLLDTVGSGLEAKMVGQLGPQLPIGTSRYGLFDAYVRERLGSAASDGIRALSRIAGMMKDRVSFGLSVRELDRMSDREGVSGALLQTLRAANILQTRGDRVSFSHEMFLNVFAAEAIVRRANGDAEAVVAALRLPQHLDVRPLVLGAIDDHTLRRQVLLRQSDARTMRACLAGQCGRDAQLWANQRIEEALGRLDGEIEKVSFEIEKEKAFLGVRPASGTVRDWSAEDCAVLDALPSELMNGRRLDDVLRLIGKMDRRLVEEHRRLRGEAEQQKVALRSGLYPACYVSRGWENFGLARICVPVQSGQLYSEPAIAPETNLLGRLASDSLSPGQVGFLIGLYRYSDHNGPSIAGILPSLLSRYWPYAAYHLRLELLEAAAFGGHSMTDDERLTLIAAIEALPPVQNIMLSTAVVDALKMLGALDDGQEEYIETVKKMIAEAMADQGNPLMWDVAVGLWNGQFDHPYDGAYWEGWNELSPADRKTLLTMAAQSVEIEPMFVPSMIAELASYSDPAVGTLIARWAGLPPTHQVIMGDAIRDFEMAHAALARLRCPPPDRAPEIPSAAAGALLACGDIFYWLNRDDLPLSERKLKCAAPLSVLSRHELGVAAAVLGEFFRSDMMFAESAKRLPGSEPVITSFGHVFPDQVAAIYRAALENPAIQTGYFDFFRIEAVIEKALSVLGHFGNANDIRLLRPWLVHPDFGQSAIQAIKEIEEAPQSIKARAAG